MLAVAEQKQSGCSTRPGGGYSCLDDYRGRETGMVIPDEPNIDCANVPKIGTLCTINGKNNSQA